MSVARVHYVKAARKEQGKCGKCGDDLPKGQPYRWYSVGFRSHYASKRCMKSTCSPRQSELESSKLSSVYSAQEGAEDELAALRNGEPQDQQAVQDVMTGFAEAVRETADEYREADEAIGGGGTGTISEERADLLNEAADELDGFSPQADPEQFEACEDAEDEDHDSDTCEACRESKANVWSELIDEAESAIGELSFS